jgi:hypothetical protein
MHKEELIENGDILTQEKDILRKEEQNIINKKDNYLKNQYIEEK